MELSWAMKLRIAAVAGIGVVLIGIFGWRLAGAAEATGSTSYGGAVTLVALALLAGFIGYFASWPHGREIGILTVPFGLAVWALRSGNMTALIQLSPTVAQRRDLAASLRWEPIVWLVVVGAGCIGPLLCQKIFSSRKAGAEKLERKSNPIKYLNAITALAGSGVMAQFFLQVFAQDVTLSDERLGSVVVQPAAGQIAFAVLMSFGLAAFVVKKFLDAGYVWPTMATFLVTLFAVSVYAKNVPYLAQHWPAAFFSNAVISILPVQMVAFGTLGSVAGFWMGVRYGYWRKHEI